MKTSIRYFSYAVLLALLVAAILVFAGEVSIATNKTIMLVLTICWFVSAPVWMLTHGRNDE